MKQYRFAGTIFDPETRELIYSNQTIELKPKNAGVLEYLIKHRDRVIGREELFETLWDGVVVTDQSLTKIITELRTALGDSAKACTYIRTLHKKGYKWVFPETDEILPRPITSPPVEPVEMVSDSNKVCDPIMFHHANMVTPIDTSEDQIRRPPEPMPAAITFGKDEMSSRGRILPRAWMLAPAIIVLAALSWFSAKYVNRTNTVLADNQNDRVELEKGSMALLPFHNLTGDPEKLWVERGLRDMVAKSLNDFPGAELVPMSDLLKSGAHSESFNGSITEMDRLKTLHRNLGFSWLVGTEVFIEDNAYRLTFHMYDSHGDVQSHSVSGESLTNVTELMTHALASKSGLRGVAARQDQFSENNFINESYAKGIHFFEETDDAQKAVNHFRVCLDNDPGMTLAKLQLARCRRYLGELDQSEALFKDVIEQARLKQLPAIEADALRYLSSIADKRGAWDEAISHAEKALNIYQNLGQRYGQVMIANQIVTVHAKSGSLDKARQLLDETLKELPALGNRYATAQTLIKLGTVLSMQGNMSPAEDEFAKALVIVRDLGDRRNELAVLHNLANIMSLRRQFDKAFVTYEDILALRRRQGDEMGQARTLLNLSSIALIRKNARQAETLATEALKLSRDMGNKFLVNTCLNQLGAAGVSLGEYGVARAHLKEALELANTLGNAYLACDSICYMSILELRQNNLNAAKRWMNTSNHEGGEEPFFYTTKSLLAYEEGAFQDAYDLQLKAKSLARERWGETDEKILATYQNAARNNKHLPLPDPQYMPVF